MSATARRPFAQGAQKAAVLMLALGEERAALLLGRMHDDEVRDLSAAMASLGAIAAADVEELCNEFSREMGQAGALIGGWETTERMLLRSLPKERVAQIMDELRGPAGRNMWEKLGNVNESVLANYLKNEYPQTVAVVLSRVKPDHAARVLALLPEAFAMEVVMRMLRMESPQTEALEGVERTLKAEFMSNLARTARRDPHELMAEIFNNLDRSTEARLMASLEGASQESAGRIRSLMFTFEDLRRLDAQGMPVLLRAVEKDKLAIALKGASEGLREMFLKGMSERAGRMLRDDIAALGPVRLRDVEEAQSAIVVLAKELAQQGELQLSDGMQEAMVE
ncbi:flagellar motor switch protein FliG [Falsiroseomonas selenitidurans]|uniref:Flagellar motor switch protein FliG n=1 Tax=Falsiroseomonas selenitidurans TaxID=2716335 RepID=A0ABX1EEN1_9PROT|nr:flagellar motor switch protein FliG [Falsiroseomonas selenitidurans]NKC33997.1 flagellar motor switch protein FliG [Falsiroseomonas selenitidurans]